MKTFIEDEENKENCTHRPYMLNMFCALHEFYALIALEAVAKTTPFRKSHEKWLEDFNAYKDYFMNNLAQILYDYTVFSVLTELRHGDKSNYEFRIFDNQTRYSVLRLSQIYTPESILKTGIKMFDEDFNSWHNSYGGYSWLMIAKSGLMYKKVPNIIFIDHCVDLCHNNGSYFNKHLGILICTKDYRDSVFNSFLNKKKHSCNPFDEISQGVSWVFKNLVKRAFNLGIIQNDIIMDDDLDCCSDREQEIFLARTIPFRIGYSYDDIAESFQRTQWDIFSHKISSRYPLQYLEKIDLSEAFDYYIPVAWGEKDLLKERIILTGKDYDNGYNMNRKRRNHNRDRRR